MNRQEKWIRGMAVGMLLGEMLSTAVWAQEPKSKAEEAKQYAAQLKDKKACVRRAAAYALGEMNAKEYAEQVVPLLKDKDAQVRVDAAGALGKMEAKEYAKQVALLLKDKDQIVRGQAAWALGLMEAKEYAKDLEKLLTDKAGYGVCYTTVAEDASDALKKMGYKVIDNGDGTYKMEQKGD